MGTYRFILAILVILSHTGLPLWGYNQGVVAVVSFLLISGYTMQILMDKYYGKGNKYIEFYIDRILRIFPQMVLWNTLTLLLFLFFPQCFAITTWMSDVSILKLIENYLVLPLGYFMVFDLNSSFLVPQAWTLGLELTFYLVFPIIYRTGKRVWFFIASFAIFLQHIWGLLTQTHGDIDYYRGHYSFF